MKNKILWGLAVLPLLVTAVLLPLLAEKVPMHYNLSGAVDRWGSKYETLLLPVVILALALLWSLLIKSYRKRQQAGAAGADQAVLKANERVLYAVGIGMTVLFSVIQGFILYTSFAAAGDFTWEAAVGIGSVIHIVIGIFIILMGGLMRKSKRNTLVGLRTFWSMKNDRTWEESNRFAGYSFEIAGAVIIVSSMLTDGLASVIILLGVLVVDTIVCTVYSYRVYQKYK